MRGCSTSAASTCKAIEKLLALAAQPDAAAQAKSVLAFETRIAQAQWTAHRLARSGEDLQQVCPDATGCGTTPGYHWQAYLAAIGVTRQDRLPHVGEPSYFKAFGEMVRDRAAGRVARATCAGT